MTTPEILPPSTEAVCKIASTFGLEIKAPSLVRDESGSDFIVYHCADKDDQKWILRFPRRPEVAKRIHTEKNNFFY